MFLFQLDSDVESGRRCDKDVNALDCGSIEAIRLNRVRTGKIKSTFDNFSCGNRCPFKMFDFKIKIEKLTKETEFSLAADFENHIVQYFGTA